MNSIKELAEKYGTPLYLYDLDMVEARYRAMTEALGALPHTICYSLKANANGLILAHLAALGAGADVVSGFELKKARMAGFPPSRIVFAGVGKTPEELQYALKHDILMLNVESAEELWTLAEVAQKAGTRAPVALRVNPAVESDAPAYFATGKEGSKFGIPLKEALELYAQIQEHPALEAVGIHAHIGSQIHSLEAYLQTLEDLLGVIEALREKGIALRYLDLGGGFGIAYREGEEEFAFQTLAQELVARLQGADLHLILEPGRYLIGPAGTLVTKVLYRKEAWGKRFVVVDAGSNDCPRPATYNAYHRIEPLQPRSGPEVQVDVVGPICEPGDVLGKDRRMPLPEPGDLLLVRDVGAYCMSMASQYNARPRPPEVILYKGQDFLGRVRERISDLYRHERSFAPFLPQEPVQEYRVAIPVTDIRSTPELWGTRVSQGVLGDPVRALREVDGWVFGFVGAIGYPGWVQKRHLAEAPAFIPTHRIAEAVVPIRDSEGKLIFLAPMNALLQVVDERRGEVQLPDGRKGMVPPEALLPLESQKPIGPEDIPALLALAQTFLGTPYLWGGLTPFGFDCSGLVYALFQRFGRLLPRDSSTQRKVGRPVPTDLEALKPGDLVFFPGHVGLYLGERRYIHANLALGGVVISSLDPRDPDFLDIPFQEARRVI